MKIEVRNFLGIKSADLDFSKRLVFLGGRNNRGKSSIANAVGCVMASTFFPVDGITKSTAGQLVKRGASAAMVHLEGENDGARFKRTLTWPDCGNSTLGKPPESTKTAVGFERFTRLTDDKQRSKFLQEQLKADPTFLDFRSELQVKHLPAELIAQLWQDITGQKVTIKDGKFVNTEIGDAPGLGWDIIHDRKVDERKILKQKFKELTATNWGADQSAKWLPDNWDVMLEGASEETLNSKLADERTYLEKAIGVVAISEEEKENLKARASKVEHWREQHKDSLELVALAQEALNDLENALKAIPNPASNEPTQACPHCNMAVAIKGGKLVKPAKATPTKKELEEFQAESTKVAQQVMEQREWLARHRGTTAEILSELKDAEAASAKLEKAPTGANEPVDLDSFREAERKAAANLAAFLAKRKATELHQAIVQLNAIVDTLAPNGLRRRALSDAIDAFNRDKLAPLCAVADWDTVKIHPNNLVTYGESAFNLASKSERFRTDAILRFAFADIDRSALVILDGADILDDLNRRGLSALVMSLGISCLVVFTVSDPKNLPNLSAFEAGLSYWVSESGEAVPLEQVLAVPAEPHQAQPELAKSGKAGKP